MKTPSAAAAGLPTKVNLETNQGILLPPYRLTLTETCRESKDAAELEPQVTEVEKQEVHLTGWRTMFFQHVPRQSGVCQWEVTVEGATRDQRAYRLTALSKAFVVQSSGN
jgi:hypothetical protein